MKRRLAPAIVLVALLATSACGDQDRPAEAVSGDAPAAQEELGESDAELAEQAAAAVREHALPAFAIARVAADSSVTIGVVGRRSHDSDVELDEDAPFHLGSDTKAMTAVLLATYVQEGLLDLDSPLGELFGELTLPDEIANVSLRDVLGHRAGLTDDGLDHRALHGAPDASRARADAVEALLAAGTPGEFITDNAAALGPAGTVHCTLADWARFTSAVLAGLRGDDSPVLDAATAADLFDDDHDYVAGWGRMEEQGQTVFTHDGSNTLWYARAVLIVERDEILLMASNTGEPTAVDAMNELTEGFVSP